MSTLSERLKLKRKQLGLTQQNVADKLGVNQSTYAYYETAKNEPDLEMLGKIADIFKTTIDYLAGRSEE